MCTDMGSVPKTVPSLTACSGRKRETVEIRSFVHPGMGTIQKKYGKQLSISGCGEAMHMEHTANVSGGAENTRMPLARVGVVWVCTLALRVLV